jgi:hypothetical protein
VEHVTTAVQEHTPGSEIGSRGRKPNEYDCY